MNPTMTVQITPVSYITFNSEINPVTCDRLVGTLNDLVARGVKTLHIHFSTTGGSVVHGIHLYHHLKSLPMEIVTHNTGGIYSIGNVIFLAGSRRYACKNSSFMFHGVGIQIPAQTVFNEAALKERLGSLQNDQEKISKIVSENTQLQEEDVEKFFIESSTKDAAFALSTGIIQEIRDAKITPGCSVFHVPG